MANRLYHVNTDVLNSGNTPKTFYYQIQIGYDILGVNCGTDGAGYLYDPDPIYWFHSLSPVLPGEHEVHGLSLTAPEVPGAGYFGILHIRESESKTGVCLAGAKSNEINAPISSAQIVTFTLQ